MDEERPKRTLAKRSDNYLLAGGTYQEDGRRAVSQEELSGGLHLYVRGAAPVSKKVSFIAEREGAYQLEEAALIKEKRLLLARGAAIKKYGRHISARRGTYVQEGGTY